MNDNILVEYAYVHDNEILSYHVDICNKQLKISTKYYDKEKTSISFTGLMAHHFEDVTYKNIINTISQISTDCFIDEHKDMLEKSLKRAFPIFAENCEYLKAYLEREEEQKIFKINSTLGLCGFVIAKAISIEVTAV